MGTTLTGTTPQDTYDSLIKVTDNGPLSGTAKYLSDGLGNDSVLALSTSNVGIGTSSPTYKLNVVTNEVAGRQNLSNIDRTSGNLITLTNPTYSVDASIGLLLRVFPQSDARQGAGIIASGGTANGITDLDLFVSNGSTTSTSYSALTLKGDTGNVGIGTSAPSSLLHLEKAGQDNVLAVVGQSGYEGALFLSGAGSGKDANIVIGNSRSLIFYTTADSTPAARGTKILTIDSQGIKFGTDTAAANALDDYEEGTFTATLAPSTSGTITLSVNTCTYTKIGRQVTVKGFLTISSVALPVGTSVDIGGLPFTIINSTSGRGTFSFVVLDASVGYSAFTGPTQHTANSTTLIAYYNASTLEASDEIMFTATYFV